PLLPSCEGSSLPAPIDTPPASRAPLLQASMMPGPTPVMTAYPARASPAAVVSAAAYIGSPGFVRADPNIDTASPTSAKASKPATNSDVIRWIRHGSVWMNAASWRPSSRSSSVGRWRGSLASDIAPERYRTTPGPRSPEGVRTAVPAGRMRGMDALTAKVTRDAEPAPDPEDSTTAPSRAAAAGRAFRASDR